MTTHQATSSKQCLITIRHMIKHLATGIWNLFSYGILVFGYLFTPLIVRAQNCKADDLCYPFGSRSVIEIIAKALQVVLSMVGVVAFVVIIAGAARWMTAGGNSENVDKGKGMIAWAFLGLVLAAAAFAVAELVFKGLRGAFYNP
jgi:hypothetical protein